MSRRDQIITSATAMFASKGIAATTVREIADEVGIMSSSLYHYFESKEAIAAAAVCTYLRQLHGQCQQVLDRAGGSRDRFTDLVAALLETLLCNRNAAEIFHNDFERLSQTASFPTLVSLGRHLEQMWLDEIRAGIAAGDFRADLSPVVMHRLTWATVWPAARWFHPTPEWPTRRLAHTYAALLLDGLAGPDRATLPR